MSLPGTPRPTSASSVEEARPTSVKIHPKNSPSSVSEDLDLTELMDAMKSKEVVDLVATRKAFETLDAFNRSYGIVDGRLNLLAFYPDGRLELQTSGDYTDMPDDDFEGLAIVLQTMLGVLQSIEVKVVDQEMVFLQPGMGDSPYFSGDQWAS